MSQVPPIEPMLDLPEERPSWPKVVGIVSILWGALGLVCNGCGVASPLLMGMVQMPPEMGPMPDVMKPGLGQLVLAGIGLAMSVVLIIAGVATLQRQNAGRTLHLLWSVVNLVLVVVAIVMTLIVMGEQAAWVKDNPDSPWAKQYSPFATYIGIAFTVVLGGAWPVFCLIWFGLVKKTQESMLREPMPAE
jgi:amino acid transporter